jgi:hypothetical protein
MTDQGQMAEGLFTTRSILGAASGVLTQSCERVTEIFGSGNSVATEPSLLRVGSPLEIGIVASFQNAPRSVAARDSAHERR